MPQELGQTDHLKRIKMMCMVMDELSSTNGVRRLLSLLNFARGYFLEYKPQQHNETKFSLLKAHLLSMFGSRILYLSPLCTVIVTGVSGCCSLPARSEPDILTPLHRARQAKGNAYKLILSNSCKALIIQMWRILGTILLSESVVKISFLLR